MKMSYREKEELVGQVMEALAIEMSQYEFWRPLAEKIKERCAAQIAGNVMRERFIRSDDSNLA